MEKVEELFNEYIVKAEKRQLFTAATFYLSAPFKPITSQDLEFPFKEEWSFDGFLVGILDAKTDVQFNFRFSNGKQSVLPADRALTEINFEDKALQINKIVLHINSGDAMLYGIEIFDFAGVNMCKTQYDYAG